MTALQTPSTLPTKEHAALEHEQSPNWIDLRKIDIDSFIDTAPLDHPEVMAWQFQVEILPEPGQMRPRVVAWWDHAADRADRIEAFRLLLPGEIRLQSQLSQMGFHTCGLDARFAMLRLRCRCDNRLHYEQQLRQLAEQMGRTGKTLTNLILARDAKVETPDI